MHHSFLTPYAELNLLSYSRVNTAHSQIKNTQRDSRETGWAVVSDSVSAGRHIEHKDHIWSQSPVMMRETLSVMRHIDGNFLERRKPRRRRESQRLLNSSNAAHRPTTHRVRLLEGKWKEPEGECDLAQISSAHLSGGKIVSVSEPLAPHKNIWRGENEILLHVYSPSCQPKPVIDFPLWTIKTVCNKSGWGSALKQTK